MNILWVDVSDGSDSTGTGSQANPYASIRKAVAEMSSGDQVRILPGHYVETDSVIVSGLDGSLFAEYPGTVYIQPEKTTQHQAGLAILDANRFSLYGLTVLQAADPSGNNIGIYAEDISTFLAYTCAVSDFEIPSGAGHGIYASGLLGRVEHCRVSNLICGGGTLYGIRTNGINVIDCEVTALSGAGDCELKGIVELGPYTPTPPSPPTPPPPEESAMWVVGSSIYYWDGTSLVTQLTNPAESHRGVWGAAANNALAIGTAGMAPILHRWDGAAWNVDPAFPMVGTPSGVWGLNANSMWICTKDEVYNWTPGGGWSGNLVVPAGISFYNTWGDDPATMTLIGVTTLALLNFEGRVYDGGIGGFAEAAFSPIADASFRAIWGVGNVQYLVGAQSPPGAVMDGIIYKRTAWGIPALELDGTVDLGGFELLLSIWGADASNIWAVGHASTLLYYNGVAWAKQVCPVAGLHLTGVWGGSATDVYIVGYVNAGADRYIFHWDGTNWTEVYHDVGTSFDGISGVWS